MQLPHLNLEVIYLFIQNLIKNYMFLKDAALCINHQFGVTILVI